MSILSRLVDRLCMAIHVRGRRALREWNDMALSSAPTRDFVEAEERFRRFISVWPYSPTEPPGLRLAFMALSDVDQASAVEMAPAYIEATIGRRRMLASNWLRAEGWRTFASRPRATEVGSPA